MHNKLPQDLINSLQNNNLIPVVGAGVTMSLTDKAGKKIFPSWAELLGHAAEELRIEGKKELADGITSMMGLKRYQLAAQFAREGLQGTLWSQFFKKHFEEPANRVFEDSMTLPRAIWRISNRVLTLNYDKVLRGACPDFNRLIELDNSNKAELADFKRGNLKAPAIWHFHGRIDNISTLIFTAESYSKLYADSDKDYLAALEVFKGLCRDQRLLFVGCSLEDAELLHEMGKQHQLFAGNIGPHYALVRQDQHATIKQKINGLPVDLLTFEDFGTPLMKLINAIASHVPQKLSEVLPGRYLPALQPNCTRKIGTKIALLSASPLNEEQHYIRLIKEFKKISCPIDYFQLSIDNLNNLQGYDYLLILSKVIKNKLLIEDEYLCSQRISFKALELEIGNENTAGLFIFVDQLPDLAFTSELHLPTLIMAELEKKQLENVAFQLFRKNNLHHFENSLVLNPHAFELWPLTEKVRGDNNIQQNKTPLPDGIDPRTMRNFIGRRGDLEQICHKLLVLKEEGGVLTIKGSGGIGKTAIVKKITVALAERCYFEGGITFVDCESITDSPQFKYKVASAFNLEQAEDLRQHLRDHHDQQSRLIILDNFETLIYLNDHQEINSLLNAICDYATIVITSREPLQIEGEVVYEMRQLTTDEAVEIFIAGLNHREISSNELAFLRQEIIETLLDNNPLAIKLITANMPKGKSFAALKTELETDLFSKISDSELEVFDDSSDLNISRKKSIYGSILYSYIHLLDNEQRAFELLSLFPDGIDLETFKKLTRGQKIAKNSGNSDIDAQQMIITDKIIKTLENKSMIENNSGQIKLQSIVGKFAEAHLRRRENLTFFYRNAFVYNHMLTIALIQLKEVNERQALRIFNSQQANFLKSIVYIDKINFTPEIVHYLDNLGSLFISICSMEGFNRELSAKVDIFHGRDKQCIDMILLYLRYFDGDFESVFAEIKLVAPLESLAMLDRSIQSVASLAYSAFNIYLMEGEALRFAQDAAKHKLYFSHYPYVLLCLGEYNKQLVDICKCDFFALEVRANMGLATLEAINAHLLGLYDKAHLKRMQFSYARSKLVPFEKQEIEALVTVNPYTRGLKGLMLAFVELDIIKADKLYQESIGQLSHIKYFYVEALYFYAKFLQTHKPGEVDNLYSLGIELAKKHHYRFLQYRFEQLIHPTSVEYDPRNYPLPDNENFTDYIQFLIKENKQNKDNKNKY